MHRGRDAESPRRRQRLNARGHVHGIAGHISALVDHIAQVDADADQHTLFVRPRGVEVRHGRLHLDGAVYGRERGAELHQESVADGLDLAAVVFFDAVTKDSAVLFEKFERQRLVAAAEGGEAHHVREHDGRQATLSSRPIGCGHAVEVG